MSSKSDLIAAGNNAPFVLGMLENEQELAEGYVNDLDLTDLDGVIAYVKDDDSLFEVLLVENPKMVFWVDINHGPGKEGQGLDWIKLIKQRFSGALIIAFTAYEFRREACLKAGATHFYVKGGQYEENIKAIREEIIKFAVQDNDNYSVKEYYASVMNVDKEAVKLNYFVEGIKMEGLVPTRIILATLNEEPSVNDYIKVAIIEKGPTIKHVFSAAAEEDVPAELKKRQTVFGDDDDLTDSSFWTNYYI
jgi:ActR/RegA family two-component response regulator